MLARRFGTIGAGLGLLAVALGAFGAHALRNQVAAESLQTWRTAVDYHFWHALALLAVAVLAQASSSIVDPRRDRWMALSAWCFIAGIVLFSGSLYALVLGAPRWTGAITPAGGLVFMVGWLCLLLAFRRLR